MENFFRLYGAQYVYLYYQLNLAVEDLERVRQRRTSRKVEQERMILNPYLSQF